MFPLYTSLFPASAPDLSDLLNASVQRLFANAPCPVAVRDENYPRLAEITITLDGAELRSDPPRPPRVQDGGSGPGVEIGQLHLQANEASLGPAIASIRLDARNLVLNRGTDANGEIVLVLKSAADGQIEASAETQQIESAIAAVAKQEAAKHGVTIDQVQLSVRPRGERSLDADVQLRAKKLFFTTVIKIAAKLDLDEQLNATVSGLTCSGDGAIGSLACGVLQPHLQKIDGRSVSLLALPLGEIRLREVRLAAGDRISVRAEFGA
ncbi:MAG: hypothetical protein ACR2ID_06120 [Chthoniobacterales bacterium]